MTQRTVTLDPARLHGLTDRDRALLSALHRHRVLPTPQIARLYGNALQTARHRLTRLRRRELWAIVGRPGHSLAGLRIAARIEVQP